MYAEHFWCCHFSQNRMDGGMYILSYLVYIVVTQVFDHDGCFNIQTEPNKNYMNQFPENK